jgi:hypothetical protein
VSRLQATLAGYVPFMCLRIMRETILTGPGAWLYLFVYHLSVLFYLIPQSIWHLFKETILYQNAE